MLDYSGCVLYNWALLDEKGPVDMNNARMLRRFTGLVDEEWFFKTHLVIEAAAAPAVAALNEGADVTSRIVSPETIQDCHEVLSRIEDCFGHVVRDCLPLMFERHGQHGALCDYYFFYARLRPFINGRQSRTTCPKQSSILLRTSWQSWIVSGDTILDVTSAPSLSAATAGAAAASMTKWVLKNHSSSTRPVKRRSMRALFMSTGPFSSSRAQLYNTHPE